MVTGNVRPPNLFLKQHIYSNTRPRRVSKFYLKKLDYYLDKTSLKQLVPQTNMPLMFGSIMYELYFFRKVVTHCHS